MQRLWPAHGASAIEWYWILWFALVLTGSTSLLSGVFFTLLGEAIKRDVAEDIRAAGWLGLLNTAGAMFGAFAAAFWIIPRAGLTNAGLAPPDPDKEPNTNGLN